MAAHPYLKPVVYPVTFLFILLPGLIAAQSHTAITRDSYSSGEINGYWEFLPQGYNSTSETFPLLVYLHGNSGSGNGSASGLNIMLSTGVTRIIDQGSDMTFTTNGVQESFIVLSPQKNQADANWNATDIAAFLDFAVDNYRVDLQKVYLTGYSMGGRGVYNFLANNSLREQAPAITAVAVVGGSGAIEDGCNIASAGVPILHYHSIHDNTATVTYESAKALTDKIENCQAPFSPEFHSLDLDENDNPIDHDATDTISYDITNGSQDLPNVYRWLLKYSRSGNDILVNNYPPSVYAGEDVSISLPLDSLVLHGVAEDQDGAVTSYMWKQIQGPAGPTIEGYNTPDAIIRKLRPGQYTFQITVEDDKGDMSQDEVKVVVDGVVNGVDAPEIQGFKAYPNPFTDIVRVWVPSGSHSGTRIHLYDLTGRQYGLDIAESTADGGLEYEIRSPDAAPGVYMLHVIQDEAQQIVKVIKR